VTIVPVLPPFLGISYSTIRRGDTQKWSGFSVRFFGGFPPVTEDEIVQKTVPGRHVNDYTAGVRWLVQHPAKG
jgi:hypothetical protein